MFFKRLVRILLLGIFVLQFSCGLKVDEKPAENTTIKIDTSSRFSYISDMGKTFKKYFYGELTNKEISEFVFGIIDAIESFEVYTQGEKVEGFKPGEVRSFLTDKGFLKGREISDSFLEAILDLKVVVLGGRRDLLTRKELRLFVEDLKALDPLLQEVRPLMPLLNPKLKSQKAEVSYDEAKEVLLKVSKKLAPLFASSGKSYQIHDLERFIKEFRVFLDWDKNFESSHSVEHWMMFLRAFKSAAVRPSEEVLAPRDWLPLFEEMSAWYIQYLRYQHMAEQDSFLKGKGFKELKTFVAETEERLTASLSRRSRKGISVKELNALVESFSMLKPLPFGARVESIQALIPPFLNRVFGDLNKLPVQRKPSGFTRQVLAEIMKEYREWEKVQNQVNDIFEGKNKSSNWSPEMRLLRTQLPDSMAKIVTHVRPLFAPGQHQVFLVEELELEKNLVSHSFYNLSAMNIIRAAMNLGIRGYATDLNRKNPSQSGLKEGEVQEIYEVLQPLGSDLGIMDPRSTTSGKRSFLEANLFTYVSDGLQEGGDASSYSHLMNYYEGIALIAFLYSGGKTNHWIYGALSEICPTSGEGIHGLPMLHRECVKQNFLDAFMEYATSMPKLRSYIEKLSWSQKLKLSEFLMGASYDGKKYPKDWVEKSELSVMSMVVHYAEAVMTRYNANGDEIIDTDEVWEAYPIYRGLLEKMLKMKCIDYNDEMLRDVFRYMVTYAAIPEPTLGTWLTFRWNRWGWKINMDRGNVIEVFSSVIKTVLAGNGSNASSCNED